MWRWKTRPQNAFADMIKIGIAFKEGSDRGLGVPTRGSKGAAGWDVRANFKTEERSIGCLIKPGGISAIPTGLILEIPKGFECQVRSRSGLSLNHGVFVLNSPGTIDSDYRGEVFVILANFGNDPLKVSHGDRIAQLVFAALPKVEFIETLKMKVTTRDDGGFGSTGLH